MKSEHKDGTLNIYKEHVPPTHFQGEMSEGVACATGQSGVVPCLFITRKFKDLCARKERINKPSLVSPLIFQNNGVGKGKF